MLNAVLPSFLYFISVYTDKQNICISFEIYNYTYIKIKKHIYYYLQRTTKYNYF